MEDTKSILSYKQVQIVREEHILLEDFSLTIESGEFVYLRGAVGTGKSSLLKTIYGELPIHGKEAQVLGYDLLKLKQKDLPKLRRSMGIVFQDFQLLPDRSAYDNLDIVLRALGFNKQLVRSERIAEALRSVGLENKGYKYPHELSGGEQQRVAIARALLAEPHFIIADEPTANLDPESGEQIAELLHRLTRERGTAVLMATHNASIIAQYPARIIDLEALQGQASVSFT